LSRENLSRKLVKGNLPGKTWSSVRGLIQV
jgi:hypothetical protein